MSRILSSDANAGLAMSILNSLMGLMDSQFQHNLPCHVNVKHDDVCDMCDAIIAGESAHFLRREDRC